MDRFEILKYWDTRSKLDKSVQSTTNDFYLRVKEYRLLKKLIKELKPNSILDLGCGDGWTTHKLACYFPKIQFWGIDFSENMIKNAKIREKENLTFLQQDVLSPNFSQQFDLAYTTRCLINLTSYSDQIKAVQNIFQSIKPSGSVILIENYLLGHQNFNFMRKKFGLPEIKIRSHNLFFDEKIFLQDINNIFTIKSFKNISSTYYFLTRIVYRKFCDVTGRNTNYLGIAHRVYSYLPNLGNFGPIHALLLQRKIDQ